MPQLNFFVHPIPNFCPLAFEWQPNTVFERFNTDVRIKKGQFTIYLAFFQKWNSAYFQRMPTLNSASIVERAKFESKTTYDSYLHNKYNSSGLK